MNMLKLTGCTNKISLLSQSKMRCAVAGWGHSAWRISLYSLAIHPFIPSNAYWGPSVSQGLFWVSGYQKWTKCLPLGSLHFLVRAGNLGPGGKDLGLGPRPCFLGPGSLSVTVFRVPGICSAGLRSPSPNPLEVSRRGASWHVWSEWPGIALVFCISNWKAQPKNKNG